MIQDLDLAQNMLSLEQFEERETDSSSGFCQCDTMPHFPSNACKAVRWLYNMDCF